MSAESIIIPNGNLLIRVFFQRKAVVHRKRPLFPAMIKQELNKINAEK